MQSAFYFVFSEKGHGGLILHRYSGWYFTHVPVVVRKEEQCVNNVSISSDKIIFKFRGCLWDDHGPLVETRWCISPPATRCFGTYRTQEAGMSDTPVSLVGEKSFSLLLLPGLIFIVSPPVAFCPSPTTTIHHHQQQHRFKHVFIAVLTRGSNCG